MRSESPEREQLEKAGARHFGELPALVVTPYLVAYVVGDLVLPGSVDSDGLFIVVLAVLVVGSSLTSWRRWHPYGAGVRLAVIGASTLLGVLVAGLVGQFGVA